MTPQRALNVGRFLAAVPRRGRRTLRWIAREADLPDLAARHAAGALLRAGEIEVATARGPDAPDLRRLTIAREDGGFGNRTGDIPGRDSSSRVG